MFSFIKKKDEYTNLTMMGGGDGEPLFATIDVTSYSCFNIIKRTDRRDIILKSLFWRFVDTGGYIDSSEVECLYEVYLLKKRQREMRRNAGFLIPEDMRDMVVPKKVMYECLNDR